MARKGMAEWDWIIFIRNSKRKEKEREEQNKCACYLSPPNLYLHGG